MEGFNPVLPPGALASAEAVRANGAMKQDDEPIASALPQGRPDWLRHPDNHTPDERSHIRRYVGRVIGKASAERIRSVVLNTLASTCRTRKEAVNALARILHIAPTTANAYMVGLRLLEPMRPWTQRVVRKTHRAASTPSKKRMVKDRIAVRMESLTNENGRVSAAPAPTDPHPSSMAADLRNLDMLERMFAELSPAARSLFAAHVMAVMGWQQ